MITPECYLQPHTDKTRVVFVGGKYDCMVTTVGAAKMLTAFRGLEPDLSEERSHGVCVHHPIFDGAPKFEGYAGPMAGGTDTPLRYESWDVYNMMSL